MKIAAFDYVAGLAAPGAAIYWMVEQAPIAAALASALIVFLFLRLRRMKKEDREAASIRYANGARLQGLTDAVTLHLEGYYVVHTPLLKNKFAVLHESSTDPSQAIAFGVDYDDTLRAAMFRLVGSH